MALHRRAARRDESEKLIVEALLKAGWSVLRHSSKDGPDLICAKWDVLKISKGWSYQRCVAVEVKTGKRPLREGQARWMSQWPGETAVLRSVEDALAL